MSLGIFSIVFMIISLIFGIINNSLKDATIWALWAIWAAIALGTIKL